MFCMDVLLSRHDVLPSEPTCFVLVDQLTYRQPAQNGVLTDQLCQANYCIHLSIMPMHIAITIT